MTASQGKLNKLCEVSVASFIISFIFIAGANFVWVKKKDPSQRKREIKIWLPGTCRSTNLNYSGDKFCSHCVLFIVKKKINRVNKGK